MLNIKEVLNLFSCLKYLLIAEKFFYYNIILSFAQKKKDLFLCNSLKKWWKDRIQLTNKRTALVPKNIPKKPKKRKNQKRYKRRERKQKQKNKNKRTSSLTNPRKRKEKVKWNLTPLKNMDKVKRFSIMKI